MAVPEPTAFIRNDGISSGVVGDGVLADNVADGFGFDAGGFDGDSELDGQEREVVGVLVGKVEVESVAVWKAEGESELEGVRLMVLKGWTTEHRGMRSVLTAPSSEYSSESPE